MTRICLQFLLTICLLTHLHVFAQSKSPSIKKRIVLNAAIQFQVIDGFGTNVNPAYWMNGKLKPVLDSLVSDLGSTWIRFDCFGRANWLDPAKQLPDGNFPADYLHEVYTNKEFKDAWAAFRFFNSKGIEPVFNISGAIPDAWSTINPVPRSWTNVEGSSHDRLKDFTGYATMVATLLSWAREKEGLKFSLLMPFNETDLGFPEGPRLLDEDCVPAFNAIVKKLEEYHLSDIKCVIMDDSGVGLDRIKNLLLNLKDQSDKIKGFGVHAYGSAGEDDNMGSGDGSANSNRYAKAKDIIQQSAFKDRSFLLTEYGDLDQSGEIEFDVAWRSTRRLLKCLNGGITGAMEWDAFDNFHKHDTAFALYGLFKTDTINWKYSARARYYAAKQVYKYVLPGFQRIAIETPDDKPNYIYNEWKYTLRNMLVSAYRSPDGKDFTLVGMSNIEQDVELNINLKDFAADLNNKTINYYRTRINENCKKIGSLPAKNGTVTVNIPAHSIFTITSVR